MYPDKGYILPIYIQYLEWNGIKRASDWKNQNLKNLFRNLVLFILIILVIYHIYCSAVLFFSIKQYSFALSWDCPFTGHKQRSIQVPRDSWCQIWCRILEARLRYHPSNHPRELCLPWSSHDRYWLPHTQRWWSWRSLHW